MAAMHGGYKTVSRPYNGGAFFRVEETVTRHGDQEFVRHVVRHPGGVAVVALSGRSAVCVEQYRPAVQRILLEVPAGRPKPGEDPEQTGRRELLEETGCEPTEMVHLTRFYNAPCFCDGVSEVFVTRVRFANEASLPAEDLPTHVRLIDLDDVEYLIRQGAIVDAKTIIALLLARSWCLQASGEST
jgi:ADP-ribose pyrophosphatase